MSIPGPDIVTMCKFLLGSCSLPTGAYFRVLLVLQMSTEVVWQPSSILVLKPYQDWCWQRGADGEFWVGPLINRRDLPVRASPAGCGQGRP